MKTTAWFPGMITMALLVCTLAPAARATTYYVTTNGNDAANGLSWATAKQTIQAAIDLTVSNDTVLVSNGVYATGGRVVYGAMTNRVAITNAIRVLSMNGPAVTTIKGNADPVSTNGNAAVRCVYVGTNAYLSGFTLTNGHTRITSGDSTREHRGGGMWCVTNAVVTNCILTGNSASYAGGGSIYGTLINCMLSGNSADLFGGGATEGALINCVLTGNSAVSAGGGASYGSVLVNCTLSGNAAVSGGGDANGILFNCVLSGNVAFYGGGSSESILYNSTLSGNMAVEWGGGAEGGVLNNCLLSGNSVAGSGGGGADYSELNNCTIVGNSSLKGGGSWGGTLNNCIVYSNSAPANANYSGGTFSFCCTTPLPSGPGNITNNPQFVSVASSNFHLLASSPCLDKGSNGYVQGSIDLDGNTRIVNGNVDMGAYEFQIASPAGYSSWASAITNGLTNYNQCATGDGYPNLLKYATGSSPTNSDAFARMSSASTNGRLALRFNRNTNATDVTVVAEASNSATNNALWIGLATNINGSWGGAPNVSESGTSTPVVVTVQDTAAPATNRFLRLRVTRP